MATFVFNIAKGRAAYYASLPAANDSLIVIPLETAGLEANSVLIDKTDVAALVAGTTNEQTTMGRKTGASVVVNTDNTNDRVDCDLADVVWTAATGNAISAVVIAYKPDTSSTDAQTIPMTYHDFVVTPNGGDISCIIASAGFYRAA